MHLAMKITWMYAAVIFKCSYEPESLVRCYNATEHGEGPVQLFSSPQPPNKSCNLRTGERQQINVDTWKENSFQFLS